MKELVALREKQTDVLLKLNRELELDLSTVVG
jgi:hypothetical protein